MAEKLTSIPKRIAVVRDYSGLWQQFFTFFADDLTERAITPEEEEEFGKVVSMLAVNHYKFAELSKSYFKDAPKVLEVLEEAVSLDYMKHLPDATFSKIQVEWHALFLGMNKALGKLLNELPPKQLAQIQRPGEEGQG